MKIKILNYKLLKSSIAFSLLLMLFGTIVDAKENQAQQQNASNIKKLEIFYNDKKAQINTDKTEEIANSEQVELSMLLNLALQNNPKVHKALFKSNATKTVIGQAKGLYAPELMLGSGFAKERINLQNENSNIYPNSFSDFMYGRISVSQLVYDFGTTSLKIKMAKDLYESSKFEIDTEINNLVYEVRDKYYYLIFTKLQKRATEELSLEFKDQISLIKEHYKKHSAKTQCSCIQLENMGDIPIQELNIANTERLLNESQNDIELTQVNLNNLIGLPYSNPYKISDKLSDEKLEITSENLVKIANTSRPELKYAQKQIELAQKKEKSVIKDITPRLNLFGSYGGGGATYQSESYNNYGSYQVGAMLSTPWINPVIVHKKLEEAKFAKNYEQANALEMAYNTYLEIQESHISYSTEIKNIEKCKKTLEKAQKVLKIFKKMYADGEDCYIHVGEFTCIVFEAKINYYNALYKLNSAKAAMDKAVGKIITKEDIITNL